MSPRSGGEAAKFGLRYEGRWTVRQLLAVLGGQATSILVEDEAALAEGAEFTIRRDDGSVEVHQVKRQRGMATSWSLISLREAGVLAAAAVHADAGRRFRFVSTIPAPWLQRLSDAARRSEDAAAFVRIHVDGEEARRQLAVLEAPDVWNSTEAVWRVLRHVYAACSGEEDLRATNAALAAVYVRGADPALMAVGLGDLVKDHLGLRLDVPAIRARLGNYGMAPAPLADRPAATSAVADTCKRWSATVTRELLRPEIPRDEADTVTEEIRAKSDAIVLVAGSAGVGKSAVLHQVVARLTVENWPILAMRIDRLEPFTTPSQLAAQLDLTRSPVPTLGAAAGGAPCLLVIDQLDAVSLASGRLPLQLDPIEEMLRQTRAFPGMRVLLACRQYDLDNDHRLRTLVASDGPATLRTVGSLDNEQIDTAIGAFGLAPARLTADQRTLIALPLHLVLLSAIADQANALEFQSTSDLLDAFYERKERDCRLRKAPEKVRYAAVIEALAQAMSARQRLSAPRSVLDTDDLGPDADVLASEHVLVRDGTQLAFFHEAFFDYAFARGWVADAQDLRGWLLAGEQELFRRAQVRQILVHLHGQDPERFRRDVRACLADDAIRFHIKDVVLGVLGSLTDPSSEDWRFVSDLRESDSRYAERLWAVLRNERWFCRADAEGALAQWLGSGDPELQTQALTTMGAGAAAHGDRIAELLGIVERDAEYGQALLGILRAGRGAHTSRALFDRVLHAVRDGTLAPGSPPSVSCWPADRGDHDLFLSEYRLHHHEPTWAAELVAAWLAERPGAFAKHGERLAVLESSDDGLLKMIDGAADGAPLHFARLLAPYMVAVMRACALNPDHAPISDRHFGYRDFDGRDRVIGDGLLSAMGRAMRRVGQQHADALGDLLSPLLAEPYDGAQWLAYQALLGAGVEKATWAADVVCEADWRLECGYRSDSFWTTRELLLAIGEHIDDKRLARVETAALRLATNWESTNPGCASFTLLSALPEGRLSDAGRQRLAELRAIFGVQQPDEPSPSVVASSRGSPVPSGQAQGFSDDEWLAAMREHDAERSCRITGGAAKLSLELGRVAAREPVRFTALGMRLDADYHPAYATALLTALAHPTESVPPHMLFGLVRHVASFGHEELEPEIGSPLRTVLDQEIPADIIDLLVRLAGQGATPNATSDLGWDGDVSAYAFETARGEASNVIARILAYDVDGRSTAGVASALPQLADDEHIAVRACVAELMGAALRHARDEVLAALPTLLAADDSLLAAPAVQRLFLSIGAAGDSVPVAVAIAHRALHSSNDEVREVGGRHAAYAALEWNRPDVLSAALSGDHAVRRGVALVCASRLPFARDVDLAADTLVGLFDDPDDGVRGNAAKVAAALRGSPMRPHASLLRALVSSPAFDSVVGQLLISLMDAPDRIDDLLALTVQRAVARVGDDGGALTTSSGGDAQELGRLVLRWYAQADDADGRRSALDLVDVLLTAGSFGVAELVTLAER